MEGATERPEWERSSEQVYEPISEEERKSETERGRQPELETEVVELGGATKRSVTHGTPRVLLTVRVCRNFSLNIYIFHVKAGQYSRPYTELTEQSPCHVSNATRNTHEIARVVPSSISNVLSIVALDINRRVIDLVIS